MSMSQRPVRVAIVGCGDVVSRRYMPALACAADEVEVVACCDPNLERAERAADASHVSSRPRIYGALDALLKDRSAEAVLNLTPAPLHFEVSMRALTSGLHVYSEKPLAGTLEQADGLIEAAARAERLLLCAPAVMAAPRFRWLRAVLDSGRLGEPTLIRGQIANLGPAAWRPYRSDPAPYYQEGVGPVVDEGVYLLHAVTGLMGPARRLQAIGAVAIPERVALSGPRPGASIAVTTSDHVLMQLEFDEPGMAQLLSSFAVPATKAPTLEVHCTRGTASLSGHLSAAGPVDVFVDDDGAAPVQGWMDGVPVTAEPPVTDDLVAGGALHFVSCLRGDVRPVLTAEHARHVLEITLTARQAVRSGQRLELGTDFPTDPELPTIPARPSYGSGMLNSVA